jgi:hypothetical protein
MPVLRVNPRRCTSEVATNTPCNTALQAIPCPGSKHTVPVLHCPNCDLLAEMTATNHTPPAHLARIDEDMT